MSSWTSKSAVGDSRFRWEERIRRAQDLQREHSAAADPLYFYEHVLRFQNQMAADFTPVLDRNAPLREQVDLTFACSRIPRLLSVAADHGPESLSRHASNLCQEGETRWRAILETGLMNGPDLGTMDAFFARAVLQPIAENLQLQLPPDANYHERICPAGGGLPQMSVLRPEGDGASRWLMCSFCLREWEFRRIICPACGEEDKENLPRYSAEQCAYVHVEACDTCKRYLKSVDMTVNGRAVPMVDEAALATLDLWATGHGYVKLVPNLIGL